MAYRAKKVGSHQGYNLEHTKYMNALQSSARMFREILTEAGRALVVEGSPPNPEKVRQELLDTIQLCRDIFKNDAAVDEALRSCGLPQFQRSPQ